MAEKSVGNERYDALNDRLDKTDRNLREMGEALVDIAKAMVQLGEGQKKAERKIMDDLAAAVRHISRVIETNSMVNLPMTAAMPSVGSPHFGGPLAGGGGKVWGAGSSGAAEFKAVPNIEDIKLLMQNARNSEEAKRVLRDYPKHVTWNMEKNGPVYAKEEA